MVPQDISRVFLNLLNNACYAAHQKSLSSTENFKPTLWIKTEGTPEEVKISIKDNGTGIPQQVVDKIYEPFMTTKPSGSGTGLGLSLSYDIIVTEHQGKIDVETEDGQFTVFTITLPKSLG